MTAKNRQRQKKKQIPTGMTKIEATAEARLSFSLLGDRVTSFAESSRDNFWD
jgi:hypothetical protein